MNNSKLLILAALLPIACAYAPGAFANDDLRLEEIVVTAQKREQSLQDVPIAVAVLDADFLEQSGIVTLSDAADKVPGLTITSTQSAQPVIRLRGVGSNDFGVSSDESIPVYLDGVYLGAGPAVVGDLLDVEQIEVLKGPQGTLFGRNAVGGAISVRTATPSNEAQASFKVGAGNHGLRTVQGLLNVPLVEDRLFLRVSGGARETDGWQTNIADSNDSGFAQDRRNGRLKLVWTPSDIFQLEFGGDWQQQDDNVGYFDVLAAPGLEPFLAPETLIVDDERGNSGDLVLDPMAGLVDLGLDLSEPVLERDIQGVFLKLDWDISDSATLTSISSYRESEELADSDTDGTELFLINIGGAVDTKEYSQEIRLSVAHETLNWFVGVSGYKSSALGIQDVDFVPLLPFGGVARGQGRAKTESFAFFGDAIWSLSDRTNLSFGLRYSYDKKSMDVQNPNGGIVFPLPFQFLDANGNSDPSLAVSEDSWNDLSPRLVLDHVFGESFLVYAGITQGYKSGGFNAEPTTDLSGMTVLDLGGGVFVPAVPFGSTDPFDEEKITNYEAGFKSMLQDGRLRLNGSLFYYDFEDLQFLIVDGVTTRARNAGEASGLGIDMDATYLASENLTLTASLGWLDSEYGADVLNTDGTIIVEDGQDLPYAPSFSGTLAADYRQPVSNFGELRFNFNYAYTGERTHNPESTESIFVEGGFGLLGARVSLTPDSQNWELAAWGKNLTDEFYINTHILIATELGVNTIQRGQPRTYGLEFSYFFD